jgi:molecular chaperone HtpG
MTGEEIKKYINQIAFSGAAEFVEKFKDKGDAKDIIGKFGFGFYSAFMVADKVEILSRSYKAAELMKLPTGSVTVQRNFNLATATKAERGTRSSCTSIKILRNSWTNGESKASSKNIASFCRSK